MQRAVASVASKSGLKDRCHLQQDSTVAQSPGQAPEWARRSQPRVVAKHRATL